MEEFPVSHRTSTLEMKALNGQSVTVLPPALLTKVLSTPYIHGHVILSKMIEEGLAHTEKTASNHWSSGEQHERCKLKQLRTYLIGSSSEFRCGASSHSNCMLQENPVS